MMMSIYHIVLALVYIVVGVHATDVTNASRTSLMNLETLQWDLSVLNDLGIPQQCLPHIYPSSHIYGHVTTNTNSLDKRLDGVSASPRLYYNRDITD